MAYPAYFENRILLKPALGAYVALQTTVLHTKRFNLTESPIFVILCVVYFQRQSFFTFILFPAQPQRKTQRCVQSNFITQLQKKREEEEEENARLYGHGELILRRAM